MGNGQSPRQRDKLTVSGCFQDLFFKIIVFYCFKSVCFHSQSCDRKKKFSQSSEKLTASVSIGIKWVSRAFWSIRVCDEVCHNHPRCGCPKKSTPRSDCAVQDLRIYRPQLAY